MSFELDDGEREIAEGVIAAIAPEELPLLKQLMIRPRWRDRL